VAKKLYGILSPNRLPNHLFDRLVQRDEDHLAGRRQGTLVDDAELIAGARAGDRIAARRLYDRHAPRVYRLIYRSVGDEELAREYTQDTFVKAFQRLEQYRGDSAFSTWLHSVAMSMLFTGLRRLRRIRAREFDLEGAASVASGEGEGDPHLRDRLRAELERLPARLRMPVVLHDIEGFTHREIADMLAIPEGTSKARLAEARTRLREALASVVAE
jgi:RNA polymerase sigma-70 factor (ECF subfamily)